MAEQGHVAMPACHEAPGDHTVRLLAVARRGPARSQAVAWDYLEGSAGQRQLVNTCVMHCHGHEDVIGTSRVVAVAKSPSLPLYSRLIVEAECTDR